MSEHTKGEWKLNGLPSPPNPSYYCLYVKDGGPETIKHICQIGQRNNDNWKADARLIATAPVLLRACKDIFSLIETGELVRNTAKDGEDDWALRQLPFILKLKDLQNAISKAEGKE